MYNCISQYFYEKSASHSGFMLLPLYFDETKTGPTPSLDLLWKMVLTTISVKYGINENSICVPLIYNQELQIG